MNSRISQRPRDDAEFFVGYLPTPPRTRRRLTRAVLAFCCTMVVLPIGLAHVQRDPGAGRWDLEHQTQLTGRITDAAVPIVQTDDARNVLLVGEGKHAAPALPAWSRVTATGTAIRRDGWDMIEVTTATPSSSTPAPRLDARADGAPPSPVQHFRGEILDSKCYLGAMKPGDGKPHKACAALCLRGGIPPLLRTDNGSGDAELYLLTAADGSAVPPDELIPFVDDPIELDASPVIGAGKPTLRLIAGSIRRRR